MWTLQHVNVNFQNFKIYIAMQNRCYGDFAPILKCTMNPGPIRNPCIGCGRPVKCNQQALMCDFCDKWVHRKCTNPLVCESDFFKLEDSTDNFFCQACMYRLPEFSESFFHDSSLVDETFSSSLSNMTNISGEESESCLAYTDLDQNMSRDVNIDSDSDRCT